MLKSGLQRRLLESHLVIALAGVVFVFVLFLSAAFIGRSADKLTESVGPLPHSALSLTNGLQSSIAANHGWVYLGDPSFIELNAQAWTTIDSALEGLKDAQLNNEHIFSSQVLQEITDVINEVRDLQTGISYVAETKVRPALEIYEQDIAPIKLEIEALLDGIQLLNKEFQHPLVESSLTDISKHFSESVLQLELAIKSREVEDTEKFREAEKGLLRHFAPLENISASGGNVVSKLLSQLKEELTAYLDLADQSLLSHQAKSNTQVREFLFDRAVPLSNGVIERLQKLEQRATGEVSRYRDEMSRVTTFTLIAAVVALIGLVIAAVVVSFNNANGLLRRLADLSNGLEAFSDDNRLTTLEVQGNDEISSLAKMFNHMVLVIREKQITVQRYQNELEDRVESRTRELFQSRELSETALRSIGDALITVDREGLITRFNPAAEQLLDISSEASLGTSVMNVLVFDESDETELASLRPVEYCIENNQVFAPEETLHLNRNGAENIPVKISAAPISGHDGNADGAIVIVRDVTREQALQNELSYRANHDLLTGLANRSRFNQEMSKLLTKVKQSSSEHVLVFMDLDKFKNVNDSAGHAAGDELLRQLARLLSDNLRPADLLARLGGDEFAIILRDCTVKQAYRVCEKLRRSVADFRFVWDQQAFQVGVSIGLKGVDSTSTVLSELLSQADAACYAAKNAGRNTVHIAQPSDVEYQARMEAGGRTDSILRVIESSEADLFVNEICPASGDADPVFRELILQFRDQSNRVIPASQISAVAERYKQMMKLDLQLLGKSLKLISDSEYKKLSASAPLIVQFSPESLADEHFLERVEASLHDANLNHNALIICINENAMLKNMSHIGEAAERWEELGVDVMLEGFSGGLSSLTGLDSLPVRYLKIDNSLIREIASNLVHKTIVSSIIQLAHLTGKEVVAAAGDSGASFRVLKELEVDFVLNKKQQNIINVEDLLEINLKTSQAS